jgi:hypothetical protein
MSWTITPQTKVPVDPQFGSVSLLLHGDGSNGSTTIVDSSRNAVAVTRAGNTPPTISTVQSKYGGSSIALVNSGGVTGYLDLAANSLFSFPSDFTFECWVYVSTQASAFGSTVIETTGNFTDGLVLRGDSLQTSWSWAVGGSFIGGGSLTLNAWNHLAVSRSGSTIRVFRDGVQQGTATNSVIINPTAGASRIGEGIAALNRAFNGYIDDLRITKGIARYTANFTPPAAPFPDI